ncbi:Urea transporter [compost metagenome]
MSGLFFYFLKLPKRIMHPAKTLRRHLLGFSQIFLQNDLRFALIILASIALAAPRLLPGALLGALAGPLAARLARLPDEDIDAGLYGYNAILLGLLLPFSFQWSVSLVLLVLAGILVSVLMQAWLLRPARHRHGLPAYTFAFVAPGWLLLALGKALGLTTATAADCLGCSPLPHLDAVGLGIGEVIFLGEPLAGVLLWFGLLLADRRAAAWALAGSAGALLIAQVAHLPAAAAAAEAGLLGLNGALAGIALGQAGRRCLPGICAIVLAVLLQPCLASFSLPPLTAPFIFACWLVIAGQRLLPSRTPRHGKRTQPF